MIKKIALGVLILLAICSLLLVGQIKVATYLFDHKLNSAFNKVERAVPGLKLSYTPGESSFTQRHGRIFYTVPLKPGNTLGVPFISGAVDLKLAFGPLRISGAVDSVAGEGNLESVLNKFKVDPISFSGAFKATAVTPRLEGVLKTDSFLLPTSTGICKFGQNALKFTATSKEDVDLNFDSAGIVCEGAMRYNDKPNYRLDLIGLNVSFLPRIINKKPHFESLVINMKNLDFKFSTLYAIGFEPDANVRDPSLQEAISFNNVSAKITLSQQDDEGMSKLTFDNTGNYGFAFPYIQYDQEQPFYQLDNFKLSGSLERISIPKLYDSSKNIMKNASETFDSKAAIGAILSGFTDTIHFTLDQFGYTHNNASFMIKGSSDIAFDNSGKMPRVSKLDSEYRITADKSLVDDMAGQDYGEALATAVNAGQVIFDGARYDTTLKIKGKEVTLNNIALSNLQTQDDQLYEEEQRALKAQQEKEKAEREALQHEIEEARRAQENLPSIVEGSLNSEHMSTEVPTSD